MVVLSLDGRKAMVSDHPLQIQFTVIIQFAIDIVFNSDAYDQRNTSYLLPSWIKLHNGKVSRVWTVLSSDLLQQVEIKAVKSFFMLASKNMAHNH